MQNKIVFIFLFFLGCANVTLAQQPQWELFFPDLSGPIAVDPTDSDIIYIASGKAFESGMWKTTDAGQTWNLYSEGWGMGRPRDILINPDNPLEILAGGGSIAAALKSTDGGQTWIRSDYGLRTPHRGFEVSQLVFDRQRGIYYLADLANGWFCGLYRSVDGVQWEVTSLYGCPLSVLVDESNGDVYASTEIGTVWKSTDTGSTWIQKNNGLPTNSPFIWHLTKVNNSQTLYCTLSRRGIYKTLDGGDNWFSVNDSVTSQLDFRGGLIVSESDTNIIFAGASGTVVDTFITGGIYRSSNGGDSWEQYNIGLPDTSLDFSTQFIFLDNKTNRLYGSILSKFPFSQGEENIFVLQKAVITEVLEPTHAALARQMELRSFPNPFNSQTTLVYTVPAKSQLTLQIFNINGREVVRLLDETVSPGEYRILWNGRNNEGKKAPSGVYFARIQVGVEVRTIKLLMLN